MTEDLIRRLVKEFEVAIRMMARDKSNLHVFDVGTTPEKQSWSMMIIFAPTEVIDKMRLPLQETKPLSTSAN